MKYFSPSYWFKLWLLSAQLFSDQTKNTNAMLIDKNKNIKNWANKNNTSLDSVVTQSNFINSSIENITNNQFITNKDRNIEQFNQTNLDLPRWDQNLTTIQDKRKNRVKRYNQKLPIDPISQLGGMWCGLAVAEMILRYLNINVNTLMTDTSLFQEDINYIPNRLTFFQRLLGFLMQTDNERGTQPENFLTILNSFISNRNLNDRREYSVIPLSGGFTQESHQRFYDLVSESLNANMPIAIAYRGTLPWDTEPRSHFMLINGVEGNPSNLMTLRYNVIDPDPSGPRPPNYESIIPSSYWVPLLFTSDNPNDVSYIFCFGGTYFPPMEVDEEGFCKEGMDNNKPKNLLNSENILQKENCILKLFTVDNKEITQFKILDENTQSDNLKAGTIYVGTTNGVYLILNDGNVHKFDGLDFPITSIKLDRHGSAYVTNNQEEVYHLDLYGYGSKKLDKIQSSNLEKELKVNYNSIPKYELRGYDWLDDTDDTRSDCWILSMDLGKINPVDNYKKLIFIGDLKSQGWGTQVKWGGDTYEGDSLNDYMRERNYEFHHDKNTIIRNEKAKWVDPGGKCTDHLKSLAWFSIQEGWKQSGSAWLHIIQRFGLLYHWDNNNYYLQVIIYQDISTSWSFTKLGEAKFTVGRGVRLYNDHYNRDTSLDINKEKELSLYYDLKKNDFTYIHDWYYNHTGNKIIKTFNLGKINLVDNFNRIEFLGDNENFKLSRVSWGNKPYYSSKKLNDFNNQSFYEIIKNYKFDETNQDKIADYTTMVLQPKTTEWWSNAWLEWSQSLGLTWYWEDNNYFLQVISSEYANDGGSLYGGSLFMGIGNGIRLHNDDVEIVNENADTNSWKNNEIINVINNEENTENLTSTTSIEPSNNFNINDINSILNYQNQSLTNVSSTNILTI